MNKTIYKYELKITDRQNITMPVGSEMLSIQAQDDIPCIWALVDPSETGTTEKIIETFGTGHPIHYDIGVDRNFMGTYQTKGLVFHVFEYTGV